MAVRRARSARPARAADQHFLKSPRLAAELVRDAGITPRDLILDLGAGAGRLTAPLADCARRVTAVELDPVLAAGLRRRFSGRPNVDVVEGDALRLALPDEPFRVLANVPFGRTSAILRKLLDDPRTPLDRADLIVEWGVVLKRTRVWPACLLNAYWGAWYELVAGRRLPRRCFEPAPSVDAGVLRIVRRARPLVEVEDAPAFRRLLRAAFAGERVIHGPWLKRTLRELGLHCRPGPTELDAFQWAAVFGAVCRRG